MWDGVVGEVRVPGGVIRPGGRSGKGVVWSRAVAGSGSAQVGGDRVGSRGVGGRVVPGARGVQHPAVGLGEVR